MKELQDGTYSIDDLADMHEALWMQGEISRLASKLAKEQAAVEAASKPQPGRRR